MAGTPKQRNSRMTVQFAASLAAVFLISGCAGSGHYFYDSAFNDHNRAPAAVALPKAFDTGVTAIDPMHNQAQADFLFLKSEMQSNSGQGAEAIETLKDALVYDPASATFMQKIAIEYYRAGKVTDALTWAERALEQSPGRRDLNLLVAGLHTTTKNYGRAESLYKALIARDKHDTEATLYLGAVYTERHNYPKALATFRGLTLVPDYASAYLAHYYMARVYSEMKLKNNDRITAELKKAIALKPDFFEAVLMLGHVMLQSGPAEKAYAFYAGHQQKHGPNAKLAELLSQYYITRNDYDKAFEQLEILDASAEDQVQVKLKMALILIDKKVYDRAIVKLNEILKIAPESDKVRFYLSAVYEEKQEFENAFREYMKIGVDSSYFEEARLHAAYLSKLAGEPARGIAVLKDVIEKKPENPQTYFMLSQLFEEGRDLTNALHTLKKAQERFPEEPQVYYFMGAVQDQMNLKDDMVTNMKKVVELDAEHAQALNYLAYTWAERGENLAQAETYARRAAAKEQKDVFILDTLGWVLFKKGSYREAIEVLERAHLMQPQVSIISEHLGDIYSKLNMNAKARVLFIKAVENEADTGRKEEIRSKLTRVEDQLKDVRTPSSLKGVRTPSSIEAGSDTGVSP